VSASRDALRKGLEQGPTVRMYRQRGLGDCFLLALPPADDPRFVLIDCGVFFATSGGAARMREIASDLADVTGSHLHLLVATHEHWDHLSGFGFARKIFDHFTVDEVWVAWTEDRNHPLANELREKRHRTARAVAAAVARLRGVAAAEADAVGSVLGFDLGLFDAGESADLALGASGTAGQMEWVLGKGETTRYLRPGGEPIRWDDRGVRFYVLGPPEDRELLERSDPSARDSEVYERAPALTAHNAFAVAALHAVEPGALSSDEEALLDASQPFDRSHRIPLENVEKSDHWDFFRAHYGRNERRGHGPSWRRIGSSWLTAAGQLALQLNEDTNNTSLALAIELADGGGDGRVLLFPGDAQVGNQLSWHRHRWPAPGGAGEVTCRDLLARTVLYKVGHHGSHNATLRQLGLELMTHPDLVAMIPVDREQAADKEWEMPFGPLADRLAERTSGRVLRADDGLPRRPARVPAADWERFTRRVKEDDLWVQYSLPEEPTG
jgi:hypothetical protein